MQLIYHRLTEREAPELTLASIELCNDVPSYEQLVQRCGRLPSGSWCKFISKAFQDQSYFENGLASFDVIMTRSRTARRQRCARPALFSIFFLTRPETSLGIHRCCCCSSDRVLFSVSNSCPVVRSVNSNINCLVSALVLLSIPNRKSPTTRRVLVMTI